MLKAPVDGVCYDITNSVSQGSFRARGRGGAFSHFVIAKVSHAGSDAWPDKIAQLRERIANPSIDDGLRMQLDADLDDVAALLSTDIPAAIQELQSLNATIADNAGTAIPNAWTAGGTVTNDTGVMQETSATLQFSMEHPNAPAWCGDDDRGECD